PLIEQGIKRTPEVHLGPVHAANLNEGQSAAIQELRAARQHERAARNPAPVRQQELEQKQKIRTVERSPELLAQYRKVMKSVIQGEEWLARFGDANPDALKEHMLLQNA
ncbi:MobA/MobL family protein, partial [Salmonella enterica subsp. enterica serovar Blockley]